MKSSKLLQILVTGALLTTSCLPKSTKTQQGNLSINVTGTKDNYSVTVSDTQGGMARYISGLGIPEYPERITYQDIEETSEIRNLTIKDFQKMAQ